MRLNRIKIVFCLFALMLCISSISCDDDVAAVTEETTASVEETTEETAAHEAAVAAQVAEQEAVAKAAEEEAAAQAAAEQEAAAAAAEQEAVAAKGATAVGSKFQKVIDKLKMKGVTNIKKVVTVGVSGWGATAGVGWAMKKLGKDPKKILKKN